MSEAFPLVPLGELLTRRKDEIAIQEANTYKRLTIRMYGKGIVVRDMALGQNIGTKNQFTVYGGQLLLSKIDARNGAFGVIPDECDGAIITSNFWAFDVDHQKLDSRFLEYLTHTRLFVEFCIRASEGTTNRLYLQEQQFLKQRIPLLSLAEQRRIVARIEALAAKIAEARGLRRGAVEEVGALTLAAKNSLFSEEHFASWPTKLLGEVADIRAGVTLGRVLTAPTIRLNYLRVANVQEGYFDLDTIKEIDVLENEREKWLLAPDDILLTEGGDWDKLGRGAVWQGEIPDCIHQNHVFRLRVDSCAFDPYYLAALIGSPYGKAYFQAASKQTTNLASINQRQLKALRITQPPLPEQQRIVAYLDSLQAKVDALKALQAETAAELDALLPAVLDKAFKGEL